MSDIKFGQGDATAAAAAEGFSADYVNFNDPNNTTEADVAFVTFTAVGPGYKGYVYTENVKKTVYAIGKDNAGFVKIKKWNGSSWE